MAQPFRRLGQFFTNTGQRAGDFLSDAFGVTAAGERGFQQGTLERSQTESAMALARQRQEAARREQAQRLQEERNLGLGQELLAYYAQPDATIEGAPLGPTIVGGFGSDYASAAQGQLRGQEQRMREQIADPALGDEVRLSLMEALAPGSGVTQRLGSGGAEQLEIAIDPDTGHSVFVPRADAAGMRPGARPSASGGGFRAADTNAIYRQAAGLFGGMWDPISGRVAGLSREQSEQAQRIASRASQIYASGQVPDHATAVDIALQEMRSGSIPAPSLGNIFDAGVGDSGGVETMPELGPNDQWLYDSLPPGTRYRAPDGSVRTKQ